MIYDDVCRDLRFDPVRERMAAILSAAQDDLQRCVLNAGPGQVPLILGVWSKVQAAQLATLGVTA